MAHDDETRDDRHSVPGPPQRPRPGLVVVLAAGAPAASVLEVSAKGIEVGRATPSGLFEDDDNASRRHARITRKADAWQVNDLSSRNGTFVDGRPVGGGASFSSSALIRIGQSLLWAVDDVQPFLDPELEPKADGAPIVGGMLREAYREIELASRAGDTLCLRGESGSGKELAAQAFHKARCGAAAEAPFVAVNCAAIPEGLAERLLFGARKGAFSGATADTDGYVQAAHGGTLFLDEIAELDRLIQAKLLRVLENHEVLPLGASRPKRVTLAVCTASHKSLREEVAVGRFRQDLYFRIGHPQVSLPPLRERVDEIPWFVARELRAVDARLTPTVALVERCCLRSWPGNVRELLREVRQAGHRALRAKALAVRADHLSREAGTPLSANGASSEKVDAANWSDDDIRRALAEHAGNVRGTARSLGMHRNQLRRWIAKQAGAGLDPESE
jgi:DNA-binding NtrC family response regulator